MSCPYQVFSSTCVVFNISCPQHVLSSTCSSSYYSNELSSIWVVLNMCCPQHVLSTVYLVSSATDVLCLNRCGPYSMSSASSMQSSLSSIAVLSRWPRVSAVGAAASKKVKMKLCGSAWIRWWWWWWRWRVRSDWQWFVWSRPTAGRHPREVLVAARRPLPAVVTVKNRLSGSTSGVQVSFEDLPDELRSESVICWVNAGSVSIDGGLRLRRRRWQ